MISEQNLPFCRLSFYYVDAQKLLILVKSNIYFSSVAHVFDVTSKNPLPNLRSWRSQNLVPSDFSSLSKKSHVHSSDTKDLSPLQTSLLTAYTWVQLLPVFLLCSLHGISNLACARSNSWSPHPTPKSCPLPIYSISINGIYAIPFKSRSHSFPLPFPEPQYPIYQWRLSIPPSTLHCPCHFPSPSRCHLSHGPLQWPLLTTLPPSTLCSLQIYS